MALWRTHRKPKPGQALSARTVRQVAETADFSCRIDADAPLAIDGGANGPLLYYAGAVFEAWVGITSTAITARSSSTPGSGSVNLLAWNGVVLQSLGVPAVIAYNISGAAAGIPSGKYCIIMKIFESFWIVTSECA